MPHVLYAIEGNVATLSLNNPPQNRLGPQMLVEFEDAISTIEASGARALLVRAESDNFSFGGDIEPWPHMNQKVLRTVFERVMNAFNRLERLPIPVVAAVKGGCYGGGLELAVRADLVIASETARFGHSEQELGIVTLLGGVYRVAERVGRSKDAAWALTSEDVSPQLMKRYLVVSRIVPDDELYREAIELVTKLASGATKAHAAHKALLRIWATGGVAAADEALLDIGMPLFESEDATTALSMNVDLLTTSRPRSAYTFKGQ